MKRYVKSAALSILGFALWIVPAFAEKPFEQELNDFRLGISPHYIREKSPSQVFDANNVWFDQKLAITRRGGNKFESDCFTVSTYSTVGQWRFFDTSNTEWLVRLDRLGNLKATDLGSCETVQVSSFTLSTSQRTDADVGLGRIWFTNRENGLMSWTGSSSSTFKLIPNAPFAGQIEVHRNRVILADISNEQSSLRLSGELDGEDFINNASFSTSPISIRVGGVNDGAKVYAIKVGDDELVIWKAFSMFALYGYDQRDFGIRQISSEVGSIYPFTASSHGGVMKFLSNRGLDGYAPPYTVKRIGDQVQDEFVPLVSVGDRIRSRVVDSQTEWQLGISSPVRNISTTLTPGSIRPANQLFLDTLSADFTLGSYDPARISTVNDRISLSTNAAAFDSFEDGNFTADPLWTDNQGNFAVTGGTLSINTAGDSAGNGGIFSTCTLNSGIFDMNFRFTAERTAEQVFDYVFTGGLQDSGTGRPGRGYALRISKGAGFSHNNGSIALIRWDSTGEPQVVLSSANSTNIGISSHDIQVIRYYDGKMDVRLDGTAVSISTQDATHMTSTEMTLVGLNTLSGSIKVFSVRARYGTPAVFISRTLDAATTNYTWGSIVASTANCVNCRIGIQLSTDGVVWNSTISVNVPQRISTTTTSQYIRYVSTLAMNPLDTGFVFTPSIQDVALGITATGYYQLDPLFVGNDITSWGLFTADQALNNGTITYRLNSSSWTSFSEAGWTVQALNAVIGVPINTYLGVRITYEANNSSDTPTTNSITANWTEGEAPPVPWSHPYQDRWFFFYSTAVGANAYNNKVLVHDRDGVFARQSMDVGAAAIWHNKLVIGDSKDTGKIYSVETSTDGTDDGTPVPSYIDFKRIDGESPDSEKVFEKIYVTVSREDASISQLFKAEYSVDGSTELYHAGNFEISTGTYLSTQKIFFPQDDSSKDIRGHFIDLRITELTSSKGYNLHRLKLYGTIESPE